MTTTTPIGMYFLDVGQGDCSLILAPSNNVVLVDCRSRDVAYNFCVDHDIKHLSAIVVSHLDIDHISGMVAFLEDFMADGRTVGTVFVDKDRPNVLKEAKALLRWLNLRCEAGRLRLRPTFTEIDQPRIIADGPDWRIQIVWPSYERHFRSYSNEQRESNTLSSIVQVHCYGRVVTIGADAPLLAWNSIVPATLLKSTVLRAPHHGGNILATPNRWGTMKGFYDEVEPTTAVFSVGTNNGDAHPLMQHIDAARRMGECRPMCTQLTKQCHDNPHILKSVAMKHINDARIALPYRHDEKTTEVPCAGTVMVRISPGGQVETYPKSDGWHNEFTRVHVARALCRL